MFSSTKRFKLHEGLCEEKIIIFFYLLLTFISGINNVFKKCWTNKIRIVEERHDRMEAMMEVLMDKFDKMISD